MSKHLRIGIEMRDSLDTLEKLVALPEIEGKIVSEQENTLVKSDSMLTCVALITGILTSGVTVVDKVIAWRDRWQKNNENQQVSATLEDAKGNRIDLTNASRDQLLAAFDTLKNGE